MWRNASATFVALCLVVSVSACTQSSTEVPEAAAAGAESSGAPAVMTVNQLMQGIQFPLANTVFFAQSNDPAEVPRDPQPSASPNALTGLYGGWQAIENSALGLADSAELLLIPGRTCSNGEVVEVENADWIEFVADYREISLAAYEAALTKNLDAMIEVSGNLSEACLACHRVYRREPTRGDHTQRCIPGPPPDRR